MVGSDDGTGSAPQAAIEPKTQPGVPLGEAGVEEEDTDEHAAIGEVEEDTDEHAAIEEPHPTAPP